MSTDAEPAAAPPARSRKLLLVIVIVLGVVIGGGGGVFVAAPLLAGKPPAAAADSTADAEAESDSQSTKGGPPVVHVVDNMVLNPANSNGARFLLLSVGLSVKDAAAAKSLADRDAEVRDVVLGIMGNRTIEELADVGRRDSLKAEVRAAMLERFGPGTARDVYFPQFVIQ